MKTTLIIAAAGIVSLQAQQIPNPSFEEPQLAPPTPFITPVSPEFAELSNKLVWSFGMPAGICVEEAAYAERTRAADGHQVAFLQGDSRSAVNEFPIKSVFGVDISGLELGTEYVVSWQQTGRATDAGTGAISVIITSSSTQPLTLLEQDKVGTKGEWEQKEVRFTASASVMRLNIVHFIAEPGNAMEGTESTLFDDFQIKPAG